MGNVLDQRFLIRRRDWFARHPSVFLRQRLANAAGARPWPNILPAMADKNYRQQNIVGKVRALKCHRVVARCLAPSQFYSLPMLLVLGVDRPQLQRHALGAKVSVDPAVGLPCREDIGDRRQVD